MNIINAGSLDIPELQVYSGLSEPQLTHYYEPEPGLFIAETIMIIDRALQAGYEPVSFLVEERYLKGANKAAGELFRLLEKAEAEQKQIPVYAAPFRILTQITGFMLTRGVLCAMRRKTVPSADSILEHASRIVILENVMNPANLGTIFRSAAALGMDALLLTKGCTDPLYRRAVRVSVGTVFCLPWTYIDSWPEYIRVLHNRGFRTVAMALRDESVELGEFYPGSEDRIALVMGTEGPGLHPATINACDLTVRIPMACGVDSLNVAAASSIAFWHIRK